MAGTPPSTQSRAISAASERARVAAVGACAVVGGLGAGRGAGVPPAGAVAMGFSVWRVGATGMAAVKRGCCVHAR